ncbi:hypothetical protein [Streptomyces sp. NPDC059010]|uniref:hypothetical protein n=1 Tax=Streptomyces sp. NPDC059010 TaxID=3346695 RepID=UPI0036AF1357
MPLQVGINVEETDGRAAPALPAAPTSVAAFVGRTRRGVPDRPVRVSAPEQAAARFGGPVSDGYLWHALDGFFRNGGREAHVVRVVGPGTTAASTTLTDRQSPPAACLRVTAGYRGSPDPGLWGEALRVDVRDDPRGSTRLATAVAAGDTAARLESTAGLAPGTVLRFPPTGVTPLHRKLTDVDPATATVTWSGALGTALPAGAAVTTAEFRLDVRYRERPTAPWSVVEEWTGLSMESDAPGYAPDRLNHPVSGSRYLLLTDLTTGARPGADSPAVVSGAALGAAAEQPPGAGDLIGAAAARTGLSALDTTRVQLLAVPDAHLLPTAARRSVARAALDYCAARGDCLYVGSPPDRGAPDGTVPRSPADYSQAVSDYVETVRTYAAALRGSKVYGALYTPWILVDNPAGTGPAPARFVPPEGHVMGVYARTEQERGVHKAPAGDAAQVRGALDVAAAFSDGEHTDLVRLGGVNGIRPLHRRGIVVAASRTLSADPRWQFVNVRLLFNFVKSSLREGLTFAQQEPNDDRLRQMVKFTVVTPFLLGLWRQGAFGSDPPDQVFTVKCDAENNPPADVARGIFRLEVYLYAARPAETVRIVVGQQPGGSSATEA